MDTENNSYLTAIAVGFAIPITVIAVVLRLLARKVQKLYLGADDYVIIVGAIFAIGNAVLFLFSNKYGNGRHLDTLTPVELVNYWKVNYAGYQIYGVAVTLIKMSILLFYRRVFATPQFRLRTNIVGAMVIMWLIVNNFLSAFQCRPIEKAWLILIPGECVDPLKYILGVHTTNLALDIIILALPVSAVWRLQISLAKKISVAGIFLLGGLSVIIAIIRLIVVVTANLEDITCSSPSPSASSSTNSLSAAYTSISSWTAVEPAIEVLSVCLPAMAPFLHIHRTLAELRTSLRSFLSLTPKGSECEASNQGFHELKKPSEGLRGD
ncbi:MAG: hypothetical protein Q9187_006091, partial [Circinaria calcarea]